MNSCTDGSPDGCTVVKSSMAQIGGGVTKYTVPTHIYNTTPPPQVKNNDLLPRRKISCIIKSVTKL